MTQERSEERDEELESRIQNFLEEGETLLFYSREVELEQVHSRLEAATSAPPIEVFRFGKGVPFIITDKRIFTIQRKGILDRTVRVEFEAIFDYEFAKRRLQAIKELQESRMAQFDKDKWNELGYFGKLKYQQEQNKEYKNKLPDNPKWAPTSAAYLPLLVQAEKKKKLVGGEYIMLTTHMVVTLQRMDKGIDGAGIVNAIGGLLKFASKFQILYELRVRKYLNMSAAAIRLGSTAVAGVPGLVLSVLATHKGKIEEYYEPILDIIQAKADDISKLVSDLESTAR
jgi:hypothetical protein